MAVAGSMVASTAGAAERAVQVERTNGWQPSAAGRFALCAPQSLYHSPGFLLECAVAKPAWVVE